MGARKEHTIEKRLQRRSNKLQIETKERGDSEMKSSKEVEKEKEAVRLFKAGRKYGASTSIAGDTTYGYGDLDGYGFWEYQLPPKLVEERRKSIVQRNCCGNDKVYEMRGNK